MGKTLFERLGGRSGISMLVDDTVDAHIKNPAINARFLPFIEEPERLAKIKQHTIDFFIALDKQSINDDTKKDVLASLWSLKDMIISK